MLFRLIAGFALALGLLAAPAHAQQARRAQLVRRD